MHDPELAIHLNGLAGVATKGVFPLCVSQLIDRAAEQAFQTGLSVILAAFY